MLKNKINNYIEAVSKGSTYIPNSYLLDNRLLDGEKTLLSLLQASCFGDKVETFPAQKTLAEAINKSVRTIQRYLKKLKELGYINIKRRGSISNVYSILIKIAQQKADNLRKEIKEKINKVKSNSKNQTDWAGYDGQRPVEYYKQFENQLLRLE